MSSISERTLSMWVNFPPNVRDDVCFIAFRDEYDMESTTANHALLSHKKCSAVQKTPINWQIIMHGIFFVLWIISFWYYVTVREHVPQLKMLSVDSTAAKYFDFDLPHLSHKSRVSLTGPFILMTNKTITGEWLTVNMKMGNQIVSNWNSAVDAKIIEHNSIFMNLELNASNNRENLTVAIETNSKNRIDIQFAIDPSHDTSTNGIIYAACLLVFLNVLIISEIVHRTLAALFTAFLSIATLAALNDRPTMHDLVNWIDSEALLLIFSMMTIVSILMETGIFDYIAVYTFQISKGNIWKLITILCIVSATISMFLDNVVTILLLTPITVKLFECLNLNPVPVLPFIILNVNIAGLTTLIGHPPNLLIVGDRYVAEQNVTFLTYTMHMSGGVLIALVATNIYLRMQSKNIKKELRIESPSETTNDLKMWRNCANQLTTNNDPINDDVEKLQQILCEKIASLERVEEKLSFGEEISPEMFAVSLAELKKLYPIKNKLLLIKAALVILLIISLFFIESIPSIKRLSLGWCAFTGVVLLLVIADCNLEDIIQRIEWTTLIFFGSMFVAMECLARLGLINFVGKQTENLIFLVDAKYQLALAIVLVLGVSALTSSVVDSVPVTAMMVKIVVALAENASLKLPIQPLVWALAYGPTLGGNCSLYGASSNIVCATVAEKLGHKITFFQYLKIGFPAMIINVTLVTAYLLIAHTKFQWHPI